MAMTLEHPFHDHALIRKQLSEHFSSKCCICVLEVRGTAYCCEEKNCLFILHEPCALVEIPQQITKHPIHPDHLLVAESRWYFCHLCNIEFHVPVVVATLPHLEEENTIKHFAHDHSLTAFHTKVPNWIDCAVCWERISGPAYGCHGCYFFLHDTCAWLPQEMMQHPFHPEHPLTLLFERRDFKCKACRPHGHNLPAYHCQECKFTLDVTCALLPLLLQDQQKEDSIRLDHFSHHHQLLSGHVNESRHTNIHCAVCELKISGEVYYCFGCILFLHKLCVEELPKEMVHYLHPEHPLILLPKPLDRTGSFQCHSCRNHYYGMVFHCVSCKFDLDPKCALLTLYALRDGAASKIQHFDHDHPLILSYFDEEKTPYALANDCGACGKHVIGLAYSCDNCVSYVLHKSCAELALQLQHPLHPPHPLILLLDTLPEYFTCNSCHSELKGLAFRCSECDFYLCQECATERPTLKHQLHEHTLSYFDNCIVEDRKQCNSCGKSCSIDMYRCTPCNFNLHSSCLPLPPTIQHECHPYHPLVLFDKFVDGRPDDQYCDYCEEIRNPDHGVYRCEECWYTIHIGCVLPQVTLPVNHHLNKLRKEIRSLEEAIKAKKEELELLEQKLESLRREARDELS